MNRYILDACALIAYYANEEGADVVQDLIVNAYNGELQLLISRVNLLEVFYDIYKSKGRADAVNFLQTVINFPMKIINTIEDDVFINAGRLKSSYRISLADAVFLSETMNNKDRIGVTADHHEFETVKNSENINLLWFR